MGKVKEKLIECCENLSNKYQIDYFIVEWLLQKYGGKTICILENEKLRYAAIAMYYEEEALYESIG